MLPPQFGPRGAKSGGDLPSVASFPGSRRPVRAIRSSPNRLIPETHQCGYFITDPSPRLENPNPTFFYPNHGDAPSPAHDVEALSVVLHLESGLANGGKPLRRRQHLRPLPSKEHGAIHSSPDFYPTAGCNS